MGSITTLRPSATSSFTGWSAQPSGTLHGVTSDNSDSTYALWSGSGVPLVLATPADSPPVGERRHQVRVRARGEDGDAWWAVLLPSSQLTAGASAQFSASPSTVTGSWGFGVAATGSTVLYTYVAGQSAGVKINELYLDVDSRLAPTFTPQVLDASGTVTTTVTDTSQPTVRANAVNLDGLNARFYRYWVTRNGATVWDTGTVSGPSVNRQTSPLDNGTYVAHLVIWTTLGANTDYPSVQNTLTFTVLVGEVGKPDNPSVTPEPDSPFYRIQACVPDVTSLDGDVGYVEIQRVDCPVGGYLTLPTTVGSSASSEDPAQVTGNLEIIIKAGRSDDWRPPGNQTLISHFDTGGNRRSWRLYLDADGNGDQNLIGQPVFTWSTNGTDGFAYSANDRIPTDASGIARLRVVFKADDGAGGKEAIFYTRETDDGEWVQFGDRRFSAGTTSIAASTAPYIVGAVMATGVTVESFDGRIYSAQVIDNTGTILSPDFTNHLDGTRVFDDAQGNEWVVNGSASIYSPTVARTLAMLGPLASDQCAEWVDFSLPRTGQGATCEHQPESCCSYYRARTIGRESGSLRISNWSDVYEPGIPNGVIVMWPSTEASIPVGWSRVTALDGRYPKGVPDSITSPGSNGGAATHTHVLPAHSHSTSHSHTHTGNTSAGVGSVNSDNGAVGTTAILTSHVHARSNTDVVVADSGTASPSVDSKSNEVDRLEVIFAESDGTPLGVPDGALALTSDIALSGWTDFANAANRLIKGATGSTGGTQAAGALDNHTHAIGAHAHAAAPAHTHTATATAIASDKSLFAGAQAALWTGNHSHPISVSSIAPAALASAAADVSGTAPASMLPPYRNLRVKQNTSGGIDLPVGLICAWRGTIGSVPDNWQLCDGTNGTPDMFGRYPRGATASIGVAGGSAAAHTHTSPSHTHTTSGHTHASETIGSAAAATSLVSATNTVAVSTGTHTHTGTAPNAATPTVTASTSGTLAAAVSEPPNQEVAFIQLMTTPAPPPDPSIFCLEWNPDQHLIRSTGPAGPIWAPILGKFDWDVTRPFTAETGVNGTRFVTNADPGERNLTMTAAVENEADLARLRAVLARPLVLISPSDARELWAAPITESVRIVKVGRIRQVTASFIGTGPQPAPQLADVGV